MQVVDLRSLPQQCPEQWLHSSQADSVSGIVALRFQAEQYWLEAAAALDLVAICDTDIYPAGEVAIARWSEQVGDLRLADCPTVPAIAKALAVPLFDFVKPVLLYPVRIPKPWGEEVWYTGIEARGQAACGSADYQIPLPWLLAAFPGRSCGGAVSGLILLKILAPLPEEVRGDLYLELHEEKREVYVVTHVDERAWPTGVGGIRFGFDRERLEQLGEDGFRAEFLAAVQRYERVRRRIDALPEADRSHLPVELSAEEERLRAEMNAFTGMLPLRVGDVIKVPTYTPHSLQHGVRTVEFQTPVYERMILSFAQKVLTQDHWDTEKAVQLMQMETPPQPEPELLRRETGGREERIVDFEDFEVRRIRLEGPVGISLPAIFDYALIMCVSGRVEVAGRLFGPEQAGLLPAETAGFQLLNCTPGQPAVCLLALPR